MQEVIRCNKCGQPLISVGPEIEDAVGIVFKTEKKGIPQGKFFIEELCLTCAESRGASVKEYPGDGE
jgi:hypothetical protein